MRIHEIIKEKRKALALTQEQAATRLGVSASAFNKWERGMTYPDITILPALARLLGVDLNTLLSFREELTNQEITLWVNQISDAMLGNGFQAGYELAMGKIKEYPSSGPLLYTIAVTLEGGLGMFASNIETEKRHKLLEEIEQIYVRAAGSKEEWVRVQANGMLASKHMNRGEYREAEARIAHLPEKLTFNKGQMQAQLYCRTGQYEEAARLKETMLLETVNEIMGSLSMLVEIAIKEKRFQDAKLYAQKAKNTAELYELWEYSSYAAEFELASAQKDKEGCLQILEKMLPALESDWKPCDTSLYAHISGTEDNERRKSFRRQIRKQVVDELQNGEEMAFLKDEKEFQKLLKR